MSNLIYSYKASTDIKRIEVNADEITITNKGLGDLTYKLDDDLTGFDDATGTILAVGEEAVVLSETTFISVTSETRTSFNILKSRENDPFIEIDLTDIEAQLENVEQEIEDMIQDAELLVANTSVYSWARAILPGHGYTSGSTVALTTSFIEVKKGEEVRLNDSTLYKFKIGLYASTSQGSMTIVTDWLSDTYVVPNDCYLKICLSRVDETTITYDSNVFATHYKFSNGLQTFEDELDLDDNFGFTNNIIDSLTNQSILFTWLTDTHYNTQYVQNITVLDTIKKCANVSKSIKSDFIAHTGDIVNGYNGVLVQKNDLFDVFDEFKNADIPVFVAEGNHDDNSWYASDDVEGTHLLSDCLDTTQFFNRTSRLGMDNDVVVDSANPTGGYYYRDFKSSKIRVICVNVIDIPYTETLGALDYYGQNTHAIRQAQMEWLANTALKFNESGWGVVILSHRAFADTYNGDEPLINSTLAENLLTAYKSKTSGTLTGTTTDFEISVPYDFTTNPSNEMIASFSGHVHADLNGEVNGVTYVTMINSFNATGGFDAVTIDRNTKTIKTKRYGINGYDRNITYS